MAPSFVQNGGSAFKIARSTRDNFYLNAKCLGEEQAFCITLEVVTRFSLY